MKNLALAALICGAVGLIACGGGPQQTPTPLAITTASLPNGTSDLPYSQAIDATGGVGPFTWAVTSGALPHNLSLSASATNTVMVSGTPDTAAQGVAFTIKVTDSANQSATKAFTVSIVLEPDTLALSPAILDFGTQLVGSASVPQTDALTNTGSSTVAITGITLTGSNNADFVNNTTCGSSLVAGANCTFSLTFTPGQLGPSSAAITITDNTLGSPHSLSLNGIGVTSGPNATLSSSSLTFFNEAVGTTSPPQSITLSNYGTATLNISGIAASGDFGETNNCGSNLAPAASCTIDITFTPSTAGSLTGTLSVTDSAAGTPHTVALGGTGGATGCTPIGGICGPGRPACCSAPFPHHSFCSNKTGFGTCVMS